MFAFGVLLASFFLGTRSLLLFFLEEKTWAKKAFDLLVSLFYFSSFVLLFLGVDQDYHHSLYLKFLLLFILAAVTGISVFFRVKSKRHRSFFLSFCKTFAFTCYLLVSVTLFSFTAMRRFTEDRPLLKVVITGERKDELVEWKNPNGPMKKAMLPSHEVKLETMEGEPIGTFFVIGDHVAVRAKVIRFKPIFLALGMQNLCTIDGVFSGYETIEKTNTHPTMGYAVSVKTTPFASLLWKWWEFLFFQETASIWIKTASLESSYFPLVDKEGKPFEGSYLLTITEGGLSSVPFNFNR